MTGFIENTPHRYHPWLMQELKDIQQGVGTRDDRQLYSNDENYEDSSKKWQYTQSGLAES